MKKIIAIGVVVVLLVGGIFGGTALAAKPTTPPETVREILGSAVLMEAGGDYVSISDNVSAPYNIVFSPDTPAYAHVSLTVHASGMDGCDEVYAYVYFTKCSPTMANEKILLLSGVGDNDKVKTIEFDAGRNPGYGQGDEPFTWILFVYNPDTQPVRVGWNYTMTYPTSSVD